jgi:hypothetical protein
MPRKGLLSAATVAALVLVGSDAGAQQLPAKYAADFPCAADLFPGAPRSRFGLPRQIPKIPGIPGVDKLLPEENAVCRTSGLEELLMLTGRMIDRAAYSAAKGVDAVQLALGRQRTFLGPIAELERALSGVGISDPDKTEVVIRETSAASKELAVEVQQMKETMRTDPEVVKNLGMAQSSLNEAEYYAATAVVGGTLFGKSFSAASNQERAQLALTSQRAGLASDFAQKTPERTGRVRSTVADTITLRGGISKAVKNAEGDGEGSKRAKAQAKADLEAQRQGRLKSEAAVQGAQRGER